MRVGVVSFFKLPITRSSIAPRLNEIRKTGIEDCAVGMFRFSLIWRRMCKANGKKKGRSSMACEIDRQPAFARYLALNLICSFRLNTVWRSASLATVKRRR